MKFFHPDGRPAKSLVDIMRHITLVAQDHIDDYLVTTVYRGYDYQHNEPPRIFQTLAFARRDFANRHSVRYATEAQAVAGHQRIVTQLQAGELLL